MLPSLDFCEGDGLGLTVNRKSKGSMPVGGRLRHFWTKWSRIGASRRVIRWLRFGYPLKFDRQAVQDQGLPALTVCAPPDLVTNYGRVEKKLALNELVSQLLVENCITEMKPQERGYFSRVLCFPKRQGVGGLL